MAKKSEKDPLSTGGAFDVLKSVAEPRADVMLGRELGDYRITGLIAEGGMASVYRAERIDGSFERDVAIKVSSVSALNASMRERFLQEQSVLASLDHPNISRLYDAGATEEGWPYIVMEFVDGLTLTEYCANNKLPQSDRLTLFAEICDAVGFAHSHLIVHRDIKPSNVLIGADQRPRLLDFGIAKLMQEGQSATQQTALTPRYASPEQLLGEPISMASDVYQLGLLLVELLTEKPVNADEELTDAIRRAAENRSMPVHSERGLDHEMLLVIRKCLRVDPTERYSGASQLGEDIRAYLGGYPLRAHAQGSWYRFRKLLARNRPAVVTAAAAGLAALAGAVSYTINLAEARDAAEQQAVEARLAAERAQQTSDFFTSLLTEAAPQQARGQDVLVTDIIDRGVERAREELGDDDALRGAVLAAFAHIHNETGEYEMATELIDEAIAVFSNAPSFAEEGLSKAYFQRGIINWYTGDFPEARTDLESAIGIAEGLDGETREYWLAQMLNTIGMIASLQNDFEDAIAFHERSYAFRTSYYGEDHWESVASLMNIGTVYWKQGRYKEALPTFEAAYQSSTDSLPTDDPRISRTAMWLGRTYLLEGRLVEAEAPLREAVRIEGAVWGTDHTNYASALYNLGKLFEAQEDFPQMASTFDAALQIESQIFEAGHFNIALAQYQLALAYIHLDRIPEAITLADEAADSMLSYFPDGHRYIAYGYDAKAAVHAAAGNSETALQAARESLSWFDQTVGITHSASIRPALVAGKVSLETGDVEAAREHYEQAMRAMEANTRGLPDWRIYLDAWEAHLESTGNVSEREQVTARLEGIRETVCAEVSHITCTT